LAVDFYQSSGGKLLPLSFTLNMEAAAFFETLLIFCWTKRCYIPDDKCAFLGPLEVLISLKYMLCKIFVA
jgi:hypothetical protein